MKLPFDPANAFSCEVPLVYATADLLATLEPTQSLCETDGNVAATRKHIHTFGEASKAAGREGFSRDKLSSDKCVISLGPSEEESHQGLEPAATVDGVDEIGVLDLWIWRAIPEAWIGKPGKPGRYSRDEILAAFIDAVSGIERLLFPEAWKAGIGITDVTRVGRPGWGGVGEETGLGQFVISLTAVAWGAGVQQGT